MPSIQAQKYLSFYAQDVVIRDQSLSLYDTFLQNLGEPHSVVQIAGELLKEKNKIRVLDIGCGNAQALHALKEKFGQKVHTIGIDLLPPSHKPDEFIEGDALEAHLPQECDLILSFRTLHEVGNLDRMLPRIAQSLAHGGRAYLWIRLRVMEANSSQYEGALTKEDEAFLAMHSPHTKWGDTFALVEPILGEYVPVSRQLQEIARGYTLVLHRP